MIKFLLILLLVTALVAVAAIFAAVMQGKRAKKLAVENKTLHDAFWQVKEKAERLQKAIGETAKIEEAANAEQNELAKTPDSGLAGRANNLFK
jgi:ABC-type sugar transport system substrate-binding protein